MRQGQILAAAAFLLIGGAQAVYAHGLIRSNDSDGDGKLSWAEIAPTGWDRKTFDIKDMDKDGFITEQDLWNHVAWLDKPCQSPEVIAGMDKSGDGKVQSDEWWWDEAGGEALFLKVEKGEAAEDNKAAQAQSTIGQEVMINPQWEAPDSQNWQPVPAQTAAVKVLKAGQRVSAPVHNDEGWRLHLTGLPKRTAEKAKQAP